MNKELKPFWSKIFDFDWKFGLVLIGIVCTSRFFLVLQANASGNNGTVGLIMVISAIIPFIFLSKYGRKQIGITKPDNFEWLFYAILCGLFASLILHYLGQTLYGNSYQNWYTYIGRVYNVSAITTESDKNTLFIFMALITMTFSPIGEELFFRGLVQTSFAKSLGEKKASFVDSSAFAFTHISHFGLVFVDSKWQFYVIPTIIWVVSMFIVSILFFTFRNKTNSIVGAVLCHSAFNFGMTFSIFYLF